MDYPFRNPPPGFVLPETSAAQQQDPSQAVAGPPAYRLAYPHPGLGVTGYTPTRQESMFAPMQMQRPMQMPQEAHLIPAAVSFEPVLPATLQRWTQEQNPYGISPGRLAAFPLGDPAAACQQGEAIPMQGYHGFGADLRQMPHQAPAWAAPSFMHQQVGDPDPLFLHGPLPVINHQVAPDPQASCLSAQPANPSAALNPPQRKRRLADSDAPAPRPAKRPAADVSTGTASSPGRGVRMLQDARPPAIAGHPGALPDASGSGARELNTLEIGNLGETSKEKRIQTRFPFANENTGINNFSRNQQLLAQLRLTTPGLTHSENMNEVLLACEKAVGGSPADGEYNLTLEGNGNTAHVFWRIKDRKTTLWTMASDAEQLRKKLDQRKKTEAGKQAKPLARAGVISDMDPLDIATIKKRSINASILTELGYAPKEHANAVRTLSLHCDSVLGSARRAGSAFQDGDRVSSTEIDDVQHFNFTRFGPLGKNVEGLRWVPGNTLQRLLLFKEGGLQSALNQMRKDVAGPQGHTLPAGEQAPTNGVDSLAFNRMRKRHGALLRALGWKNAPVAIRKLAELCETTADNAQDGNSVSGTPLRDVEHFSFPKGRPDGAALEVLRWKFRGKVRDIHPFQKGQLEDALEKMKETVHHSLSAMGIKPGPYFAEGGASA